MSIIKKIVEFMFYYKKKFIADSNLFDHQIFIKIKNHPLWIELTTVLQLPIIEISIEIWDNLKEIHQKKNTTVYKLSSDLFVCFLIFSCFYYFSYLRLCLFSLFLIHITIFSLILFYICIKVLLNWSNSINKEILILDFISIDESGVVIDTFLRQVMLDKIINRMENYYNTYFEFREHTWGEKVAWDIHTILIYINDYFCYNILRLTSIICFIFKEKPKKSIWFYFAKILIYFFIYIFIYFGEVSLRCLLCILYLINNLLDSEQLFIAFLKDVSIMWYNRITELNRFKIFLDNKKIKIIEKGSTFKRPLHKDKKKYDLY